MDDATTQSQRLAQHASKKGERVTSKDLLYLEQMNKNAMERVIAESLRDHQAEQAHMERLHQEFDQKTLQDEIINFLGLKTKSYGELYLLREKLLELASRGELFDKGASASSSAAGGLKF